MRIALADDQPDEIAEIIACLKDSGMDCVQFANGEEVIAALRRETFDLLMLDWNMPRMDGVDVLSWTQQNLSPPPPVIMLTSRDSSDDIVHALETGATDYIRKPEDPVIVRARVKAALRRGREAQPETQNQFGGFEFDDGGQLVRFDGVAVDLRLKEYNLARLLFENLNRPLSRSYILQKVWNTSPDVETRTLDMHISRVRAKLNLRPERGFALKSIFGFGYRLDTCSVPTEAT
jgi:DNA-binding response OmpR family regulator